MANIVNIANHHFEVIHDLNSEFKKDVQFGLKNEYKQIPSKYLYDDNGCELFNKITRHPDYYLTNCEIEILNTYKKMILNHVNETPFNLVEFGPGGGIKTRILIDEFIRNSLEFVYTPIDINSGYLKNILNQLKHNIPDLNSNGIHSDYFDGLSWISKNSNRKNLVLFLGSNIGNFDALTTRTFLEHLWGALNNGDYILIGFDLCKDINILMRAYDDSDGLTRDFNLNLLNRMNRELGADFNIKQFQHYSLYNPQIHSMESYIVSLKDQIIEFSAFDKSYIFKAYDAIHLEYSQKFQLDKLEGLAASLGFKLMQNYLDEKRYFVDSLWRVEKL